MAKLGQEAQAYEARQIKSVADLPFITVEMEVKEDSEAEFPYKYIEIEEERYKVPTSVIAAIKDILADNSSVKRFKVKKSGEGLKTKYTVIPITGKLQAEESTDY